MDRTARATGGIPSSVSWIMSRIRSKVRAATLRFVPSLRPWQTIGNYITFQGHGFVAADSPELLLARHNYEAAEIRRLLNGSYSRSLEIGCGFGRLSPHIAARSASHRAVDVNPTALKTARRHYPQFDYEEASATDLPFEDGTFDLIVTWTVLQHIRPNLIDQAMREIRRVALPSATILLCEESALSADDQAQRWHTHTWHRSPEFYSERLKGFTLLESHDVVGMTTIGLPSPGTITLLRGGMG